MSDSTVYPLSDEEWDDLVHQLHHQPQARPRPFFYNRVHARLTANVSAPGQTLPGWLRRPAYAALLGALIMTLSGDGSALRPAAETTHCDACASGQQQPVLQR